MPIHLPPLNRRKFIIGGAAGAAGVLTVGFSPAAEPRRDPHLFALLSDAHIAANPKERNRGVNMTDNFRRVAAEVAALEVRPAAAFLNGDCAYHLGLKEDYRQVARLLDPLREAGLPLHLGMGNHDDRASFAAALAEYRPETRPVEGRLVDVILAERANWFLLDSLKKTNETPGELGAAQIAWLAKALDAHADKPAIIVCHHNPDFNELLRLLAKGIIDTSALFDVLEPRKHVKAMIFGHTHSWFVIAYKGIQLINLPPTAYVFQPNRPNGWLSATLKEDGMNVVLHALDKHHPENGTTYDLKWRV
ncbi:MAG TPA: metallophosphoesterase [Pirellulales bacterium]|nr:metallophosphoesterase [Pirellulales bacterium]